MFRAFKGFALALMMFVLSAAANANGCWSGYGFSPEYHEDIDEVSVVGDLPGPAGVRTRDKSVMLITEFFASYLKKSVANGCNVDFYVNHIVRPEITLSDSEARASVGYQIAADEITLVQGVKRTVIHKPWHVHKTYTEETHDTSDFIHVYDTFETKDWMSTVEAGDRIEFRSAGKIFAKLAEPFSMEDAASIKIDWRQATISIWGPGE